ncbi:hypothetical protein MCOR25_001781 [Pyricularia grisea]|uniref:Uncharacterized protein n=1 Tax=Pyricularia grisea TaxID=148305 RepID=A0A6P8B766_PYRGI|nr:hypothetical protein PgNI_05244 [Pyricularia grisea]KAI6380130.1 hypothetical protein MCOR25_001781 [Pyricularia grisea]TLD11115.1 hypothetical protein PgNI_05244 [Pyricularia grisea]
MGSSPLDPVSYFDDWFFTTFQSTPSCPGFGSNYCPAPEKACAKDPNTGRRYCCDGPKKDSSVCWTLPTDCKSDGSTIKCGGNNNNSKRDDSGDGSWCCLAGTEKCTETKGQINICWSSRWDPLNNVTEGELATVYSSLSSAQPSATSLRFDVAAMVSTTATADATAGRAIDPSLATTTGPGGPNRPTGPPDGFGFRNGAGTNQNELSGGAIAGIVIGVLAGVAMIVAAAVLFVRRQHQKDHVCSPEAAVATTAAAAVVPGKDGARHVVAKDATSSGSEAGPAEMESAQMHNVSPDRGTSGEGYGAAAVGRGAGNGREDENVGFQTAAHELPPENQQPAELHGDSIPRVMHEMAAEENQTRKSLS